MNMNMHKKIKEHLIDIESKRNIKILLAVESGSRAWGFASDKSDWDIKFIYTRPTDWYNSLYSNWDESIDAKGTDDIDGSGWILPKALRLLHKGNASMQELINSPIPYISDVAFYARMGKLSNQYFNPLPATWHYVELASGNYHRYIQNNTEYKLKRLLYVWRATMVAKYIMLYNTFPSVKIDILLDSYKELSVPYDIQTFVNKLITMKRSGIEMGVGIWAEFEILKNWLISEMNQIKTNLKAGQIKAIKTEVAPLNEVLRRFM